MRGLDDARWRSLLDHQGPGLDGGASYPVITGDYADVPAWERRPIVPGTPVAKPTPIFRKLDTAIVEEELARLGG